MVRVRENVVQRAERTLTLEGFRGVDFTSSPLRVDEKRATFCRNLLPSGGRNVKRRGWQQEAIFRWHDNETYKMVPDPVRGMWWYTWSDGEQEVHFLLVHAGTRLYASRDGGDFYRVSMRMGDGVSEAFAFGKRLYMVGHGDYLVFGTWDSGKTFELRTVLDDEDTYIPHTTMAINPEVNQEGTPIEDTRRGVDAINLLSSKRINTCTGRLYNNVELNLHLDAAGQEGSEVVVDVETVSNGVLTTTRYRSYEWEEDGEVNLYREDELLEGKPASGTQTSGDVIYGTSKRETMLISLRFDCPPPVEGQDNIKVMFTPRKEEGTDAAEKIGKCRFGILFGSGGNADRLFLAGNPEYPNVEFYSYWQDPTYFPDNGYNAVGTDASAIVGFSRVSDGVLATFKETGRGEPVIYYHTAEDEPVYDGDGKLEFMKFNLYTDAGNAGEGMKSRLASVDFYGDPLILSENGVFGISLKTNVETSDRYAAERSRNIRADLCKKNLCQACGAVFDGKYWLAVDGVCYVADAEQTFRSSESNSGYQYEWWHLDNVPATVMCVANGRLYFGTEDGRVCYFRPEIEDEVGPDKFQDTAWERIDPFAVTCEADDMTRLAVKDEYFRMMHVGDRVRIKNQAYVLWLTADEYTVIDGTLVLNDPDGIINVRSGQAVFADAVGESGLAESANYTIGEINRGWGTFRLFDKDGKVVEIFCGGFRLGFLLTGELSVAEVIPNEEDGLGGWIRLVLHEKGSPVELMVRENDEFPVDLLDRIIHSNVVTAEWYTPAMDLGTNMQTKTLTRLTVATEPGHSGRVTFGYETRMVSKLAAQTVGAGGLDFTDLSLNEFSLSAFASSWTVRLNERNVNYVVFHWRSEDPADCRVDSISARYKVTGDIKGGL